jgi:hypothetical protein
LRIAVPRSQNGSSSIPDSAPWLRLRALEDRWERDETFHAGFSLSPNLARVNRASANETLTMRFRMMLFGVVEDQD